MDLHPRFLTHSPRDVVQVSSASQTPSCDQQNGVSNDSQQWLQVLSSLHESKFGQATTRHNSMQMFTFCPFHCFTVPKNHCCRSPVNIVFILLTGSSRARLHVLTKQF